jgi:hypothetical protein
MGYRRRGRASCKELHPRFRRSGLLPDLYLEQNLIRVLVPPSEVFPLLDRFHCAELPIVPVLLPDVNAVSTIFVVVPPMVIVAIPIIVPLILRTTIVSRHRDWGNQSTAGEKRAQNQKTTHIGNLLAQHGGTSLALYHFE